jgi:hypothetical protein
MLTRQKVAMDNRIGESAEPDTFFRAERTDTPRVVVCARTTKTPLYINRWWIF